MFNYQGLNSLGFTHLPATSNTINIGDDIQVESAARLWNVRQYVERDDFSTWKSGMIVPFFGWYGYDYSNDPPKADCVLVSFHLCTSMMHHIAKSEKFIDWFKQTTKQQGFPAIARDTATMSFLRSLGVDSEFGGCVTQTLPIYTGHRSGTVSIDAPPEVAELCGSVYTQNNKNMINMPYEERLKLASDRIDVYAKAEHVHTNRIHAYLPCKALNTPVTFYNYRIFEPHRLSGLIH